MKKSKINGHRKVDEGEVSTLHKEPPAAKEICEEEGALPQYQTTSPENMHVTKGVWTKQAVVRNIYAITVKKEAMDMKEDGEGFGERKGKGKML